MPDFFDLFKKLETRVIREYIKEEGIQEGIQKGRQEGRQEFVLNMLAQKADISFIAKVTGLSEEEIRKLKNGD